jgi:hypothetical protein
MVSLASTQLTCVSSFHSQGGSSFYDHFHSQGGSSFYDHRGGGHSRLVTHKRQADDYGIPGDGVGRPVAVTDCGVLQSSL